MGLLPRDVRGMDGVELDIVIRARRAMLKREERIISRVIAEMRNLWSSGAKWSAAQVMGEEPPPQASSGAVNDVSALLTAEEEARELRAEREREEASGWAESLDGADVVADDVDLMVDLED